MRLKILLTILVLLTLSTTMLYYYNKGYDSGYEHGVIAGYWHMDKPQGIKDIENGTYKRRTIPSRR